MPHNRQGRKYIVAHNHPSGDEHPSQQDIEITKQLKSAGQVLGVSLQDHIIVSRGGLVFGREGLLKYRGFVASNPDLSIGRKPTSDETLTWVKYFTKRMLLITADVECGIEPYDILQRYGTKPTLSTENQTSTTVSF